MYRYPYDGFEPVSCQECCRVEDCSICREILHDNCEVEDCADCREELKRREAEAFCDAQERYYAPGGTFDNLFAGGLE